MTEQKEKIINEWQNKIKQITEDRAIKQYTHLKTDQADEQEDKSNRRARTKENKLKEKIYSPSSQW